MESLQRTTGNEQWGAVSNAPVVRLLPVAVCLLLALGLGLALPTVLSLPKAAAMLACLAICGGLVGVVWLTFGLPVVSVLRLLLLVGFWFKLEVNFFPIFKNHAEPPGLNLSLMLIVSVLLIGDWFRKRWQGIERESALPRFFAFTLAGLWLWCCLTVAYGAEDLLAVYALWSVASSILMCFAVAANFGERDALHQMIVCLAALIALNALFGIAQAFLPSVANFAIGNVADEDAISIGGEEVSRVRGLFAISNAFAWTLVIFLPLVIAPLLLRVRSFQRWQHTLCVLAAGTAVVVLILTYSRGSWIAFAISVPLLAACAFFILEGEERIRLFYRFASVLALITLLVIPFSDEIVSRLTGDDRGSTESRVQMIQVAKAIIADNPLLGVGLSGYEAVMRRYDETQDLITEHFDWPVHNVYLQTAAEAGLPGLLFFLMLAAMAMRRGWIVMWNPAADLFYRALALGLLTGMVAYLVTGLKEGSSFQSGGMRLFFLLCGLLFANERASRRAAEERGAELYGLWEQSC